MLHIKGWLSAENAQKPIKSRGGNAYLLALMSLGYNSTARSLEGIQMLVGIIQGTKSLSRTKTIKFEPLIQYQKENWAI